MRTCIRTRPDQSSTIDSPAITHSYTTTDAGTCCIHCLVLCYELPTGEIDSVRVGPQNGAGGIGVRAHPLGLDGHDVKQLRDEIVGDQQRTEVVLVGVRVHQGGPQSQLKEGLEAGGRDLGHGPVEFLAGHVHEVDKQVSLVEQEVVLDGAEVAREVVTLDHDLQ